MNIKTYTTILILLLTSQSVINAQQTSSKESVRIVSSNLRKIDSQLLIEMALDLSDFKISSNRSMRIIPVLETKENSKVLPEILVNGRTKHISYLRGSQKNRKEEIFTEVYRRNNTSQTIEYKANTDFTEWMHQATLVLHMNLCDCGGAPEENSLLSVANLSHIKSGNIYNWTPAVAYIEPRAEAIKKRTAEGSAYLDFPVNKTVIYPDYRRNPEELEKIRQTIEVVKNDKNTNITAITIHGYASPEGSYVNNTRLARERAEELKRYVQNLYKFDEKIITVNSTAEDWNGFLKLLNASNLNEKKEILAILNQKISPDEKEQKLKTLNVGIPYLFILQNWFPALRHSDYKVNYTVRGFSVVETKEIINKRPQLLSLQEMFLLARTYEKGSSEYNEVFDVAVRMFPEDPTANLNASSIALNKGDVPAAKKYLERADQNLAETINNQGVLAFLEGRIDDAKSLFSKAAAAGIDQAIVNLEKLR
jgi:hypothetical protein